MTGIDCVRHGQTQYSAGMTIGNMGLHLVPEHYGRPAGQQVAHMRAAPVKLVVMGVFPGPRPEQLGMR